MQSDTKNPTPADRLIKQREVSYICSISRTKIFHMLKEGRFPQPIRGITMFNLWSENAVRAWVAKQVDDAAKGAA